MIRLIEEGSYQLSQTRNGTKVLRLNDTHLFSWLTVPAIGEILGVMKRSYKTDQILVIGRYRLYKVKDEPDLTDLTHLELHTGNGIWQGYLLPTGLPTEIKKRSRIIPTNEIITKAIPSYSLVLPPGL